MKPVLAVAIILGLGMSAFAQRLPQPRGLEVQILSDTRDVEFTGYIAKFLETLQRNWDSALPESKRENDKGAVSILVQVNSDGSVPDADLVFARTSGKKAFDDAAMAAVRMSIPLKPLPPQFRGSYLKMRIGFRYGQKHLLPILGSDG